VALRELRRPRRESDLKVGDEVECSSTGIENALGEAVLSRDKARREEELGQASRRPSTTTRRFTGVIFNQVKGGFTVDLDGAGRPSCALARSISARSATSRR